jgi:phenylacetate-CoA ligase
VTAEGSLDRSRIAAHQIEKLERLLAEVCRDNRFYAAKFAGLAADDKIGSLDEFLQRLPFTHKRELIDDQLLHPPFGSNLTYPIGRYTRFCQTSATTGKPMRWLDTQESWDWVIDQWERVLLEAGITSDDRIFFAFSFGPFLGFWSAFDAAARLGCLCIPGGGMRSAARLAAIMDDGATVLCCTPTYAIRLAEVAAEEKIDLSRSRIEKIIVAGEPGGSIPATRGLIEKLWAGAKVVDQHGLTEVGPVSFGCPKRLDVLHVMETAFIAEVVDPLSGAPIPPGGTGELVLTNLGRTGSPLIRYKTGDLVQSSAVERCECGTYELALEGGILGRTDDMVVVRGMNVYPRAIEEIMRSFHGVAEFRVEVDRRHALAELRIQVEPEPACAGDAGLAHRMEVALKDALSLRIPVSMVEVGSLPRFEMKARRWVRV